MKEKILVVDDEKEIADLIEVYLQNENMEVYKFYTGKEALACIESVDFDLAILDIICLLYTSRTKRWLCRRPAIFLPQISSAFMFTM